MIWSDFTVQRFFSALPDQTNNNKNILSIDKQQVIQFFLLKLFFILY